MSYTSKYNETISEKVSKRLQVSYTSDGNGKLSKIDVQIDNTTHTFSGNGSKNIDIEAKIPITVEIEVDTRPFDASVVDCSGNVGLLTGAVVATEAAQILSINKNSKKVANSIVTGFFSYIKSEISQQISELSQNIDAQLMHVKELAQACVAKKIQMEGDFNRISSRYTKIFDDLNNELSNRIQELDKPTFVFKKETDTQNERTTENDLVNIAAISGGEFGNLQAKISTSIAKKRALDTLIQAKVFLMQQKVVNNTIQKCMLNDSLNAQNFSPICFIETKCEKEEVSKDLFTPTFLNSLNDITKKNEIIERFSDATNSWSDIPKEYSDSLNLYFSAEINSKCSSADDHAIRVKEMIQKIANIGSMKVINLKTV